jgi:hypothetical protein
MRIHQWLIPAMISLLSVTITNSLVAQDPYQTVGNHLLDQGGLQMPAQGYGGTPSPGYGGDMSYQGYSGGASGEPFNIPASSGQFIPQHSAVSTAPAGQASFQEGMNPWPQISPFDHAWSQHRIDDGLWVNETRNDSIKYHFSTAAMIATVRPPERTRIGEEAIDPDQHIRLETIVWPSTDTRNVYDSKATGGIQFKWGLEQEDEQGLELSGFYIPNVNRVTHLGTRNGDPTDPGDYNLTIPGILVNTDLLWLSGEVSGERRLRFDTSQRYSYTHEAWGANSSWYMSPLYKRGNIRIRPLLGVRYVGIGETFRFEGVDSGDRYAIAAVGGTTGTTGATGGTGTGGTGTTQTAVEITGIIFDGPEQYTTLTSATNSHLFGPELGLDYVLGGKTFQFNGSTRFGLMANREELKVSGTGFGGAFSTRSIFSGTTTGGTGGAAGGVPVESTFDFDFDPDRVFKSTKSHMHVSPMFTQDINMEVAVLDLIPFINKKSFFDKAVVKVGYSVVIATEVARPESIIKWNDQPQDPQINSKRRTNWWVQSLNLGLEWRY